MITFKKKVQSGPKTHSRKLRSKCDGPFLITNVFLYGTIENRNEATNKIFKVNGHLLKTFYESPTLMEGDVEDLSLVKPTLAKLITSLKVENHDHPNFKEQLGAANLCFQEAKTCSLAEVFFVQDSKRSALFFLPTYNAQNAPPFSCKFTSKPTQGGAFSAQTIASKIHCSATPFSTRNQVSSIQFNVQTEGIFVPLFLQDYAPKKLIIISDYIKWMISVLFRMIKQASDEIYIHQTKYVKELLKKINLDL
ncbi:hypothetical protein CR513_18023, partial [Mucuna pruriens]